MTMLLTNIMHAGGRIGGFKYTNSVESVHQSIRHKEKLIELDCVKVKDGYALAHDGTEKRFYDFDGHFKDVSLAQYKSFRVCTQFTPLDFDLLDVLARENPGIIFIIDAKVEGERYVSFLQFLRANYQQLLNTLCMQVYNQKDLQAVCDAGVNKCIVALWKYFDSDPFSGESFAFVEQASKSRIESLGVSLRYQNPTTKRCNATDERVDSLIALGRKVFIHGQEGVVPLHEQVRLNVKFGFFSSISYNELPEDFDWRTYTSLYKDIGSFDELKAKCHYLQHGAAEKRTYKFSLPQDFDWRAYVDLNSDLGLLDERMAKAHFTRHGAREGRQYRRTAASR